MKMKEIAVIKSKLQFAVFMKVFRNIAISVYLRFLRIPHGFSIGFLAFYGSLKYFGLLEKLGSL